MIVLTDSERGKVAELVSRLTTQTQAGRVAWSRAPDGEYTWGGTKGVVIVSEDRLRVVAAEANRYYKDTKVDERDFPGVDHLWALLEERHAGVVEETISAILRDLERMEPLTPSYVTVGLGEPKPGEIPRADALRRMSDEEFAQTVEWYKRAQPPEEKRGSLFPKFERTLLKAMVGTALAAGLIAFLIERLAS